MFIYYFLFDYFSGSPFVVCSTIDSIEVIQDRDRISSRLLIRGNRLPVLIDANAANVAPPVLQFQPDQNGQNNVVHPNDANAAPPLQQLQVANHGQNNVVHPNDANAAPPIQQLQVANHGQNNVDQHQAGPSGVNNGDQNQAGPSVDHGNDSGNGGQPTRKSFKRSAVDAELQVEKKKGLMMNLQIHQMTMLENSIS